MLERYYAALDRALAVSREHAPAIPPVADWSPVWSEVIEAARPVRAAYNRSRASRFPTSLELVEAFHALILTQLILGPSANDDGR